MTRAVLILALVLSVACGGPETPAPADREAVQPVAIALAAGDPAPDFEFVDIDGEVGRLSDYRGRIVLLCAWASWCPHSRAQMPRLVEAYSRYQDDGFEILGVAVDEKLPAVLAYAEEHGTTWRQTIEPDSGPIATLYQADGVPTFILIDRVGTIVEHDLGGPELEALLANLTEAERQ